MAALARFYAIAPDEILVVHDELDLKSGEAKMKLGGGVAGHNGLNDIHAQLGTPEFWRLRLGIGHPARLRAHRAAGRRLRLEAAAREEQATSSPPIGAALDAWPDIAKGDMERAMMSLHTKDGPAAPDRLNQKSSP